MVEKNLDQSVDHLRMLIDSTHSDISVRRPFELLGLNRSTLYYQGQPAQESVGRMQDFWCIATVSDRYQKLLNDNSFTCSMSRNGNC